MEEVPCEQNTVINVLSVLQLELQVSASDGYCHNRTRYITTYVAARDGANLFIL